MSAHHYSLVVPAAAQSELDELHRRALDWLVADRIVEPDLTDCVLGGEGGHRPAPDFMSVSSEPEDPECTNLCYARFITSQVNGLEIIKGRHITVSAEGSYECSICPGCGTEGPVFGERWNAAATEWIEWRGAGNFECAHCGETRGIVEWAHRDPIGFGALTFKFWNWPPLSVKFQEDLARRLGHRVHLFIGTL